MSKLNTIRLISGLFVLSLLFVASYRISNPSRSASSSLDSSYARLSEDEKRSPQFAVAGLTVAEGVEAALFASEPTLTNPTNIDIDHRGRVWVCEAYNYRPAITGNPTHEQGDRILILEDTNGDGVADLTKVFYQSPDLNAPLGIWVMGRKVIVSQSPYVWLLTDEDGDDKADKREVIFQGISGEQHDHGMHAFVFGPDGKLYFNYGNEGKQLLDGKGQPVKDLTGKPIDFSKYKQGMVFRCDPDFTNIEVLGHNFRNNYEVAVDSYGTLWQSDNDDDGNKGVRINYVMPYGNYGYTDEMTGAGWRANRTNKEAEIPLQHWHLNDPGVVPNLLQTGAGSPTGLIVYEGRLLPKEFWDEMIHCDAGPNIVRAYPVTKQGAGYTARISKLVEGTRDQWFRPADVCTAPDGSVFVADWYDPGVGGHQAGDLTRGRIFRVAPPNTPYRVPKHEFTTPRGAVAALQSPNLSVRYLAYTALQKMGASAEGELMALYQNANANPRMRARAFWVLCALAKNTDALLAQGIKDSNPDLRITALRAAQRYQPTSLQWIAQLSRDPEVQVRRECALLLHGHTGAEAASLWADLALQHDGRDRWYLEALGIGAHTNWDAAFTAWLAKAGAQPTATAMGRDVIWRARTSASVPLLASLAGDPAVDLKSRLRYFRAFDFNPGGTEKSEALLGLGKQNQGNAELNALILRHLDPAYVKQSAEAMRLLTQLLDATYGTPTYMEMVTRYSPVTENKRLLQLATTKPYENLGRDAARQLLKQAGGNTLIWNTINGKEADKATAAVASIRNVGSKESLDMLSKVTLDAKRSLALRREAARALGGSQNGEDLALDLLKSNKLSGEVKAAAVQGVSTAWRKSVRTEAAKYLDAGASSATKHPAMQELLTRKGDVAKGKAVFGMYCATCHQVNGEGMDFGPKLSEIGSKLSKEGQYLALFYPSAGISFGYEGQEVRFKDGSSVTGVISSKTETDLMMKFPGGSTQEYKMSQVKSIKQLDESMMPAGLQDAMSTDELVGLVEYLNSLKRK